MPADHTTCECPECVALNMEILQIGIQQGLLIAEDRLRGVFERPVLDWERVKARLQWDE